MPLGDCFWFVERFQRRIYNPVKHLRWNWSIFAKSSILDVWESFLNAPLYFPQLTECEPTTLVSNYTQFLFCSNEKAPSRSSHRKCSVKKDVLKNFAKFTGKHLCLTPATLLKIRLWHRCFPVNFAKFPRIPPVAAFLATTKRKNFIILCFNILDFMPSHRKFLKSFQKKKYFIYFSTLKGSCIEVFLKKSVVQNFIKFWGKQFCRRLLVERGSSRGGFPRTVWTTEILNKF